MIHLLTPTERTPKRVWKAYLHLAEGGAPAEGETLAERVLRLRAFLPHCDHNLQTFRVSQ